ncbi:putative phosphopyruvate hydratase [Helianthus annuus]|nr:putative phosphopyruvate hydratase [Helianthus annuus]
MHVLFSNGHFISVYNTINFVLQIRFSSSFFVSIFVSNQVLCIHHLAKVFLFPHLCKPSYFVRNYLLPFLLFYVHDLAGSNVNTVIGPAIAGKDTTDQTGIDNYMVQELDGTKNEWGWCKQKLGVNAILAVSLAVCKAGASVKNIPLYKRETRS